MNLRFNAVAALLCVSMALYGQGKVFPKADYEIQKTFCTNKKLDLNSDRCVKYFVFDSIYDINGNKWQELYLGMGELGYYEDQEFPRYIRKEGSKIFIREKDVSVWREQLFIDFNSNVGDSIYFESNFWGLVNIVLVKKIWDFNIRGDVYVYNLYLVDNEITKYIPNVVRFTIHPSYGFLDIYTSPTGKGLSIESFCVTSYYPRFPIFKY